MKTPTLFTALFLLAVTSTLQAADKPDVVLWGLRIVGPEIAFGEEELRPFNWSSGVTLSLAISGGDKSIIGIASEGSVITTVKDSTGKNLQKKEEKSSWHNQARIGSFPQIAPDGSMALVDIDLPVAPAAGATHIELDAEIAMIMADGTQVVTSPSMALTEDAKVTLGDLDLSIEEAGKPDWGDAAMEVTFTLKNQDPGIIKTLWIVTPDGKEHLLESSGGMSKSSRPGFSSATFGFNAPVMVNKAAFKAELYTNLSTPKLKVPSKIDIGVGK